MIHSRSKKNFQWDLRENSVRYGEGGGVGAELRHVFGNFTKTM